MEPLDAEWRHEDRIPGAAHHDETENMQPQRISSAGLFSRSMEAFDKLHLILAEAKNVSPNAFRLPPVDIENTVLGCKRELLQDHDRFRAWAGNCGAHLKEGAESLDVRLREALFLHDAVTDLLKDLIEALEEGIALLTSAPRDADIALHAISPINTAAGREPVMEDAELEMGLEALQINPSDDESGEELDDKNPVEYVFQDISQIISCLHELLTALWRPALRDRLAGCAKIATPAFEAQADEADIRWMFPKAPKFLIDRLVKAHVKRRQLRRYFRANHQKIAKAIASTQNVEPSAADLWREMQRQKRRQGSAHGSNASHHDHDHDHAAHAREAHDYFLHERSRLYHQYPFKPRLGAAEPLQCGYCFHTVDPHPFDESARLKHLQTDLAPYICTFSDCTLQPSGPQVFDSVSEWHDHERRAHQQEWYCSLCCPSHDLQETCDCDEGGGQECEEADRASMPRVDVGIGLFPSKNHLLEHLLAHHGDEVPEEEDADVFAGRWHRDMPTPRRQDCPFDCMPDCTFDATTIRGHIALHMEHVALFLSACDGPGVVGRPQAEWDTPLPSGGVMIMPEDADVVLTARRRLGRVQFAVWSGMLGMLGQEARDLMTAVLDGEVERANQLLRNPGVDVEARPAPQSPLSVAAMMGHYGLVRLLLQHGADVESRDHQGRTPLCLAAGQGHGWVVQLLISHGADLEAENVHFPNSYSPLQYAVQESHQRSLWVAELLLRHGALVEPKAYQASSHSPLHKAVELHIEDMVELFLRHGASWDIDTDTPHRSLMSIMPSSRVLAIFKRFGVTL